MSAEAHPTHRAETSEQPLTSEHLASERRTEEQPTLELSTAGQVVAEQPTATDDLTAEFQLAIREYLIRHRSIMDTLSKLQEASARVNRAVAKAVTVCGCVEVQARRQQVPEQASEDITYVELKQYVQTHLSGEACDQCRDALATELGQTFFYATALCETFNMRASDILNRELQRVVTLGVFNLT